MIHNILYSPSGVAAQLVHLIPEKLIVEGGVLVHGHVVRVLEMDDPCVEAYSAIG